MYVTKPLSLLRRSPELLNSAPKEGPNSGYLVLFDQECETTTCFGLSKETSIKALPFPQNKDLTVTHTTSSGNNNSSHTSHDEVVFIPVLGQPLSSNRYYVISRQGKHKGEASASSTEDDMGTCCCCTYIKDIKPRPLDPLNIYQQVEIIQKNRHGRFTAESVAENGFPPTFLRRKWDLCMRTPRHYQLDEAPGLNSSLRSQLPDLIVLSNSTTSKPVVVGKWYCPFMFVKELGGLKLKQQMKNSMFYEMTLEQRWDRVFECGNVGNDMKLVSVDVFVNREEACVDGKEAICEWGHVDDGVIWFTSSVKGQDQSGRLMGLSKLIVDRMRWEEERVGLGFKVNELERQVKVKRTEKFDGKEWSKFGCYVLVERFVLKRVDGTVLLTIDFKHANQIRCKWE
ncbi:uncharacterized protein LOC133821121 [Humulus lupulus]|uniref:uncharacterized protein LOC133821121 n=1 Tax=Humulus lupulus TaxID=3486 RepID=UPI002B40F49D|nr:uncharacterized protein LOC133821121 [Humulus lupulus]